MIEEMLDPGVVGIPGGRGAVLPATVATELIAGPVAVVEGRVGDNEVGFQVFVGVVEEGAFVVPPNLGGVDAPDGEVHLGQPPGGEITFLSVDGDIVYPALVVLDEFFGLNEHASGAAAGVEYPAFVGLEHFHQKIDDTSGGVELTAFFAFGEGEFAKEVFKDVTEDVGGTGGGVSQCDVADEVN